MITLTISGDTPELFLARLMGTASAFGLGNESGPVAPTAEPEVKATRAKAKDKPAPVVEPEPIDEPQAPTLDYDTDVKPVVIKLSKIDRDSVAELLGSYKNAADGKPATKASEIDAGLWGELVAKINERIADLAAA